MWNKKGARIVVFISLYYKEDLINPIKIIVFIVPLNISMVSFSQRISYTQFVKLVKAYCQLH